MLKVFCLRLPEIEAEQIEWSRFRLYMAEEMYSEVMTVRNLKLRLAHLAGRLLLAKGINCLFGLDIKDYRICKGKNGKPFMENLPVFFNISHSGEYVVCAFADTEVGIDIERKGKGRLEVARRFFHPEEIKVLEQEQDNLLRNELFYHYWCIKESFLKYTGDGLSGMLSSIRAEWEGKEERLFEGDRLLPVQLKECRIDIRYVSYTCCQQNIDPEISHIDFQDLIITDLNS